MSIRSSVVSVVIAGVLVMACSGSGTTEPTANQGNSVPRLSALSPTTVAADFRSGTTNTTVTVTGTGFVEGSVARLDGADQLTRLVSSSQLSVIITTATLATQQGARTITVFNPTPGGGISNGLTLTIGPPIT